MDSPKKTFELYKPNAQCFILYIYLLFYCYMFRCHVQHHQGELQGEHKVFPSLQTFITRKLPGIQTYFLPLLKLVSKKKLFELSYILKKKICLYST